MIETERVGKGDEAGKGTGVLVKVGIGEGVTVGVTSGKAVSVRMKDAVETKSRVGKEGSCLALTGASIKLQAKTIKPM